ncbi:MAG: nicotinate-nucleotide--dimethylbenzimidazole phosphoribosyltransferase [Desulfobacterales bacterium]|nr:MAG: nicotinate-nucleotide--dimethylbenzimidazole phosphoribosyltransferase [Desulfobacterales bacterium]
MNPKQTELTSIINGIQPVDTQWIEKAKDRTAQLVMPTRALGRLHELAERICGIQKTLTPSIDNKAILVMAGDHGAAKDGVSAYPQAVTGAMVQTFLSGGAGINAISRHVGADVWVVDMGIIPELDPDALGGEQQLLVRKIAKGTANLTKGPVMARDQAETAVLTGFEIASSLFAKGVDILGTGDMGIGNTTPSAAIGAVLTHTDLAQMVGRGTGVDDEGLAKKQDAVRQGIDINQPDSADGIDVLSKIGGFEIGGIAGCILAGAFHSRPVVIDGFISTAGALIAHTLCSTVTDYLFAGHRSEESGHQAMLAHLGLDPILDLGMRLGEGTGGALAMGIIGAAINIFTDVLTFQEAGVPDKADG